MLGSFGDFAIFLVFSFLKPCSSSIDVFVLMDVCMYVFIYLFSTLDSSPNSQRATSFMYTRTLFRPYSSVFSVRPVFWGWNFNDSGRTKWLKNHVNFMKTLDIGNVNAEVRK